MGRTRDPNRDKAKEIYIASKGEMGLIDIAAQLNTPEGTIRGWKAKDKWENLLSGEIIDVERSNQKERSAPKDSERSNRKGTERDSISWAEIENEYVTDIRKKPITLDELSKKHGISHGYIMQYAAEHDWTEKRRNNLEATKKKTADKTTTLLSDDISKATARHLRISDKLLKVVEEAIEDAQEFYKIVEKLRTGYGPGEFDEKIVVETVDTLNATKLKTVVDSFDKLQKAQRQTLAILDEKDRRNIELDERKAAGEGDLDEELIDDWVSGVMEDEETDGKYDQATAGVQEADTDLQEEPEDVL